MDKLNKRAYAEFDNMVQLKRYYGSTETPFCVCSEGRKHFIGSQQQLVPQRKLRVGKVSQMLRESKSKSNLRVY
jgi:hypothetical protein